MDEYDVAQFLRGREEAILTAASARMDRAHLAHYDTAGTIECTARLRRLLEIVIECCEKKNLEAAHAYAASLAAVRQRNGYSLAELQTAINVLEESIWYLITEDVPAEHVAYSLGMISTSLGAIKDQVACDYLAYADARSGAA
jgi:hypothetical protein